MTTLADMSEEDAPMAAILNLLSSIVHVVRTESGPVRSKACAVLSTLSADGQ